jgi:sporulation protein YlmC with PRC-barrel domain
MRTAMTRERLEEIRGTPVYSGDREKIGTVEDVYFDVPSGQPEWIAVGAGVLSSHHTLVPMRGASFEEDGLIVPFTKEQVKDAPEMVPDAISPHLENELLSYYRQHGEWGREYGDSIPEPVQEIRIRRYQWENR